MKNVLAGIIVFGILGMFAIDGVAQETMEAKKLENRTWHEVVMVKFEAGTVGKAMQLIHNHFAKAGEASGTPGPKIYEMRSGEWDLMFVWDMKGLSDLSWEISPDDAKWWNAMVEQEGGEEEAMKVWEEYMDLVEESTRYLATTHNVD